jgi:hypothetical protein
MQCKQFKVGRSHAAMWIAVPLALLAVGCGMELETGYKYRPLSATPVQRRGYYASPYTQEKAAAEAEQKQGPNHGG